jgi:hypothetical protein
MCLYRSLDEPEAAGVNRDGVSDQKERGNHRGGIL